MAMKKVRFNGLNRDVWLPDDIEVIIDIVPSWRTNVRSNQPFSGQNKTTWHDTGNPSSNAWGERSYLHSGAGGRYVGYNFAFDGERIIQLTPLNEVTWHAGTADGNKYSWGAEQCLNTNWDRALYVGAALHGGLIAAMGWNVDSALVQHNYWYGKHCPAQIRNKGQWPKVVQMVKDAAARAKAAAGGVVVDPPSSGYPKGKVVMVDGKPWDGTKDVVFEGREYFADPKSVSVGPDRLNRRTEPTTSAPLTGPILPSGEVFTVLGWCEGDVVDGESRWWVTPWGSHIWVGGTVEKPTERPAEPEQPEFDPDTVRVMVNGRAYYPAGPEGKGREVVLIEDAELRRWADVNSEAVGTVKANQKVEVTHWCFGDAEDDEYVWWIVKPAEGDSIDKGARLHAVYTFQRPF